MKPAHCATLRACSWLASRSGALIIGLAVVWMASAPGRAWGQSAWPSYPNNTAISVTSGGNVGIGTTAPNGMLHVYNTNTSNLFGFRVDSVPYPNHAGGASYFNYQRTANWQQNAFTFNGVSNASAGNTFTWDMGGTMAQLQHVGGGTSGWLSALRAAGGVANNGTVSTFNAIEARPVYGWVNNGGGTISTAVGLRVGSTGPSDMGVTVGNYYAIYLEDPSIAGVTISGQKYGVYQLGTTQKNYFEGNVGIGTTAPQYKLAVNRTIGAKEVIVTNTGWSDYVFRPGYRLRPLSEVGAYIQAHHHLPDIPSEAEVKERAVSVGEMQAKLLAKIEELTLHMIRQDQENRELRERIAQLENCAAGR